jgi:hypothetical protein
LTIIEINLSGVGSEDQLFDLLGDVLELGGPDGNMKVIGPLDGQGWGKNWNALADSLCYLDSGGIWGNAKKLQFPLKMIFTNFEAFRDQNQLSWKILTEILGDTVEAYQRHQMTFRYELRSASHSH